MSNDSQVHWKVANFYGMLFDEGADAWHAGHVNDVLALDSGGVVVASDSGGVWVIVKPGFVAIPVSDDWGSPDVNCLAFGSDGPRHIYAGCKGGLYETDVSALDPLLSWHPVSLTDHSGATLNIGEVYRIVVVAETRKIVLACSNGVFWASIPQPSSGSTYVGKQIWPLPPGRYSGLVRGPNTSIVAAAWGSDSSTALYGIFYGDWDSSTGDLLMNRASIFGTIDETHMYRTSLASCDSQRNVMYAVSSTEPGNGWMYAVLKSTDGGQSWTRLTTNAVGFNAPLESKNPDVAGGQGDYNNCIAVAPSNANLVAIGWRNGPWVSTDGGSNWQRKHSDKDNPHLHSDLHTVYFDPTNRTGQSLFVGSDGGLVVTRDLCVSFSSEWNRQFPNFQFQSQPAREFYGTLSASYQFTGLIGGGLQDNGAVYCQVGPNVTPWITLEGGDGQLFLFLRTGHALWYPNDGQGVKDSFWNGSQFTNTQVVSVRIPKPGTPMANGLVNPIAEIVNSPHWHNNSGQHMFAIAAVSNDVYGLYTDGNGGNMGWEYIGSVQIDPSKDAIWALGSGNGLSVFVGTQSGRIFVLDSGNRSSIELSVPLRQSQPGSVFRFIIQSDTEAFALYDTLSTGYILQLNTLRWDALGSGQPNIGRGIGLPTNEGGYYAMETDWTSNPKTLFVATDSHVYVSRNNGDTWQKATDGLPACPHCADLRFVTHSDGGHYLYLSTFGRSLWQARLN